MIKQVYEAWPEGIRSNDFPGLTAGMVAQILTEPTKRGQVTAEKIDGRKVYSVSPEQWREYTSNAIAKVAAGGQQHEAAILKFAATQDGCTRNSPLGIPLNQVSNKLSRMHTRGQLIRVQTSALGYTYFTTQELADECPPFDGVTRRKPRQRAASIPASFRFTNQPPNHEATKERNRKAWAAKPAIIPAHVQIQRAPTPKGRYEVDGPIIGGFVSEWRALRAA
ncbi:MAG: hypothetical protein Q7T97_02400 [Burkholderiaceae bacterium]|nr:hypothetical protein [Burkholderiaceae bacterium]